MDSLTAAIQQNDSYGYMGPEISFGEDVGWVVRNKIQLPLRVLFDTRTKDHWYDLLYRPQTGSVI